MTRTDAQRQYDRDWWAKQTRENKLRVQSLKVERKKRIAAAIAQYKRGKSCGCGENHPACLDFHHVGDDKEITVSNAVKDGWSIERVMREIQKCILLCANCHRKLHYAEKQGEVRVEERLPWEQEARGRSTAP